MTAYPRDLHRNDRKCVIWSTASTHMTPDLNFLLPNRGHSHFSYIFAALQPTTPLSDLHRDINITRLKESIIEPPTPLHMSHQVIAPTQRTYKARHYPSSNTSYSYTSLLGRRLGYNSQSCLCRQLSGYRRPPNDTRGRIYSSNYKNQTC